MTVILAATSVIIMPNKKKVIDKLPNSFGSEEEAGEFWDTHSAADYVEYLEPTEQEFKIEKRVFEVQVSEDVFQSLRKKAATSNQTVPSTVDRILRKELSLAK